MDANEIPTLPRMGHVLDYRIVRDTITEQLAIVAQRKAVKTKSDAPIQYCAAVISDFASTMDLFLATWGPKAADSASTADRALAREQRQEVKRVAWAAVADGLVASGNSDDHVDVDWNPDSPISFSVHGKIVRGISPAAECFWRLVFRLMNKSERDHMRETVGALVFSACLDFSAIAADVEQLVQDSGSDSDAAGDDCVAPDGGDCPEA